MRTHDEKLLESIWAKEVMLTEKSVFGRYFTPKDDTPEERLKVKEGLNYIHEYLGISADAQPIPLSQVDVKTGGVGTDDNPSTFDIIKQREYDVGGLQEPKELGTKGANIKKKVTEEALRNGSGIFAVNPNGTRIFIKQGQTSEFEQDRTTPPSVRSSVNWKRGKHNMIWVFDSNGVLLRKLSRPYSGVLRPGEVPANKRPKKPANIYVSYIENFANVFVIPNSSWRQIKDTLSYRGEDDGKFTQGSAPSIFKTNSYGEKELLTPEEQKKEQAARLAGKRGQTSMLGVPPRDKWEQANTNKIIEQLIPDLEKKYGKYIRQKFRNAVPGVDKHIGEISIDPRTSMDDISKFREIRKKYTAIAENGLSVEVLRDDIKSFVKDIIDNNQLDQYDITYSTMRGGSFKEYRFNTQAGITKFLRDFVTKTLLKDIDYAVEAEVFGGMGDIF